MTHDPQGPGGPEASLPAAPPVAWPAAAAPGSPLLWLLTVGWVVVILGVALIVGGVGMGAIGIARADDGLVDLSGAVALAGAVLASTGLTAVAIRSIRIRRPLGAARYRGPAILVVLGIMLVVGNAASVPFVGGWEALVAGRPQIDERSASALLLLNPIINAVVLALFVLLPRALPHVRLWPSSGATRLLLLGVGLGVAVWVAAFLVGAIVALLVMQLTGEPPPEQVAIDILTRAHPAAAILGVVILAPIVEELFFRGFVFNAWLREYGVRRALIGSALLFTVIHVSAPTLAGLLALAPILVVAFVLGYVYWRTRSLPTVIGVHATFNGMSTAVVYLIQAGLLELP